MSVLDLLPAGDSVTHRTDWRLERRAGDVGLYVASLEGEADAILQGRRPWSGDLDPNRLVGRIRTIEEWIVEAGQKDASIPKLWSDQRRVTRAALHDLWLEDHKAVVTEHAGNILVTAGIALFLALLTGGGGTVYSNANANLGVGDSSTAAAVGQTDLQASSNKLRKIMNATYPTIAAPVINFQSTFGSADANYVWNEVATFNAAAAGTMLNRVVQALGTKSGGSTWTLTETITWS